jgi:hypothetical protein
VLRYRAIAVVLSVVFASSSALAQDAVKSRGTAYSITDTTAHQRPTDLSLLVHLPFYYGFGIGLQGRFEIPVLHEGFIPSINDSISVEPSFGIAYSDAGFAGFDINVISFSPAAYGLWSFWFSEKFRAYGGLGIGATIGVVSGDDFGTDEGYTDLYIDPVVGLFFNVAPNFALRAELGNEGAKGGISIQF